jgi:hypothetical protein
VLLAWTHRFPPSAVARRRRESHPFRLGNPLSILQEIARSTVAFLQFQMPEKLQSLLWFRALGVFHGRLLSPEIPASGVESFTLEELKAATIAMVMDIRSNQPPERQPRTFFPKVPPDAQAIYD